MTHEPICAACNRYGSLHPEMVDAAAGKFKGMEKLITRRPCRVVEKALLHEKDEHGSGYFFSLDSFCPLIHLNLAEREHLLHVRILRSCRIFY